MNCYKKEIRTVVTIRPQLASRHTGARNSFKKIFVVVANYRWEKQNDYELHVK
jgi:hypothetical protein